MLVGYEPNIPHTYNCLPIKQRDVHELLDPFLPFFLYVVSRSPLARGVVGSFRINSWLPWVCPLDSCRFSLVSMMSRHLTILRAIAAIVSCTDCSLLVSTR